ncbi:hypothetical protein B0H12DRAFT_1074760 [Mycena haematopus]|nr:hypothetical protein B0H12DRAFT_1074760 [Mycena haematopus]
MGVLKNPNTVPITKRLFDSDSVRQCSAPRIIHPTCCYHIAFVFVFVLVASAAVQDHHSTIPNFGSFLLHTTNSFLGWNASLDNPELWELVAWYHIAFVFNFLRHPNPNPCTGHRVPSYISRRPQQDTYLPPVDPQPITRAKTQAGFRGLTGTSSSSLFVASSSRVESKLPQAVKCIIRRIVLECPTASGLGNLKPGPGPGPLVKRLGAGSSSDPGPSFSAEVLLPMGSSASHDGQATPNSREAEMSLDRHEPVRRVPVDRTRIGM